VSLFRDKCFALLLGVGSVMFVSAGAFAQPASTFTDGTTTSGTDPRRLGNTSRVAGEILTDNDPSASPDQQRLANEYQPKGIEAGSFLVFPEAIADMLRSNNIYATKNDRKGDWISREKVGFRAQSRFNMHKLDFSGDIEKLWYLREVSNNQINGQLAADGRYDLSRGTELTGYLNTYWRHEDRGAADASGGAKPTPVFGNLQTFGGRTTAGPWINSGDFTRHQMQFGDVPGASGATIRNSRRDRTEYKLNSRTAYEIFPGYYAVGYGTVNKRIYDTIGLGNVDRDSEGFGVYTGAGVDLTQLLRGDFLVGYIRQSYASPVLRDASGPAIKATLNWTPDRQTLIVPALDRDVLESSTTNISGILRTSASLLARREIQRNIILTGYVAINEDKYVGSSTPSYGFETRGTLTYAFNANLFASGELSYRERKADSKAVVSSFNQTTSMLRIGLRL
jgi:hypothetical protein